MLSPQSVRIFSLQSVNIYRFKSSKLVLVGRMASNRSVIHIHNCEFLSSFCHWPNFCIWMDFRLLFRAHTRTDHITALVILWIRWCLQLWHCPVATRSTIFENYLQPSGKWISYHLLPVWRKSSTLWMSCSAHKDVWIMSGWGDCHLLPNATENEFDGITFCMRGANARQRRAKAKQCGRVWTMPLVLCKIRAQLRGR